MWTVAKVKAELPRVPVKVGRKQYAGRVSGRLNRFATVTISHIEHGTGYLRGEPWHDWQFSWEAIANALNTGAALTV